MNSDDEPDVKPATFSSADSRLEILRVRARALAREPQEEESGEARIEVVEFELAHESYAVETAFVREVYPLRDITPLPCTPRYVLGIINVRGQILPVIDLRTFFDLPSRGLTDLNKILILAAGTTDAASHGGNAHGSETDAGLMEIGVLADAVRGVRSLPRRDLKASLPTLTGIRAEYLRGVTAERLVVLDAAKICHDRSLVVNEQVD